MKRLKRWLAVLLTLLVVAGSAVMPWAVSRFQDAYTMERQGERPLDAIRLTLRQNADVFQTMRLMEGEYTTLDWNAAASLDAASAAERAEEAILLMAESGALCSMERKLLSKAVSTIEPFLFVSQDTRDLTAVVWHCLYTLDEIGLSCFVMIDDASGQMVGMGVSSPPFSEVYDADVSLEYGAASAAGALIAEEVLKRVAEEVLKRAEIWRQFFEKYYGVEIQMFKMPSSYGEGSFLMTYGPEDDYLLTLHLYQEFTSFH